MENKRITYLDNLKLLLTVLVVAHHTCQAYVLHSDWAIKDPYYAVNLSNFLTVNMTFFMGAFFFISGYFIPKSKSKSSLKVYIQKKAKRLLLPILLLLFFIVPAYYYIAYYHNEAKPVNLLIYYINYYWKDGLFSYDHGWFLVSLFLYSMFYLLIEKLCDNVHIKLTFSNLISFVAIMSLLTYIIRLSYPIDTWVNILGVIGIEPAHLPQYLLWFIAGILTFNNNLLNQMTEKMGRTCSIICIISVACIYFKNLLPPSFINIIYSYFYIFESTLSVTAIVALVYIFKKYFNNQNKFFKLAASSAFGIYIVHNFYVILFQVFFSNLILNAYIKFILATSLALISSFFTIVFYKFIKTTINDKKARLLNSQSNLNI